MGQNRDWYRRLKQGFNPDENINKLGYGFTSKVIKALDGNPSTCNWEEFLAKASEIGEQYNRDLNYVGTLSSSHKSKGQQLLYDMGVSGMVVHELVRILYNMKLENILLHIKEHEKIEITLQPAPFVRVNEGSWFSIKVDGIGFPSPRFQWFKCSEDNKQWEILDAESQNVLRVEYVRKSDEGAYCCRLSNGNQREHVTFSTPTHVSVIHCLHVNRQISANSAIGGEVRTTRGDPIANPVEVICNRTDSEDRVPIEDSENDDVTLLKSNIVEVYKENDLDFECPLIRQPVENSELPSGNNFMKPRSKGVQAKDKVALLIGNSDYMADTPLRGVPQADVLLMKSTLEELNFKVFSFVNLTKAEMKFVSSMFINFIRELGSSVYIMFSFFGHGFDCSHRCYLVPTDAKHGYGAGDCFCADALLSKLQKTTEAALIVMALDTCRKGNPGLQPSKSQKDSMAFDSLAEPNDKGNTVVLYSTTRGMSSYQTGFNGLFAKIFNQKLQQKSDVYDVMQDVLSDMKEEMANWNQQQIPQFTTTLNEKRSFRDECINKDRQSPVYQKWQSIFEPSPEREYSVPGTEILVKVECRLLVLNSMSVTLKLSKAKEDFGVDLQNVCLTIRRGGMMIQVEKKNHNLYSFHVDDLQKLQGHLKLQMSLSMITSVEQRLGDQVDMDLGRPLVAAAEPWMTTSVF